MATDISNLWPLDAIHVDVRTPRDILLMQTGQLQQATKGLLESQVHTTEAKEGVSHRFDIIAPALGNYRHSVMTVKHSRDMPYPTTISSIADTLSERMSTDINRQYTEEDFIERVREILGSVQVVAVIQSLLARIQSAKSASVADAPSEEQ